MCGIAGFIDFNNQTKSGLIEKMVATMPHRGPDDSGAKNFFINDVLLGLGQSRLSIIDLTSAGHQPMYFEHLIIVFNGEIYNYKEIKVELQKLGHVFKTGSDTEVILHAVYEWGDEAVQKFIGMFVYCILDKKQKSLTITRDRAGVKPLYYYFDDGLFLFGSELKALMICDGFQKVIDQRVLPLYLQYGYIPAPHTIFKKCYKLNAGSIIKMDLETKVLIETKYWDVSESYFKEKVDLSYQEAKDKLHDLLKSACKYRMVADVPVGIFLSGGYDSTAITAILQTQQIEKLKTFTIGFVQGNNEAQYAKNTAQYLGTDHTEYYCTPQDAHEIIPVLPYYYDEPFADSSAIPTIIVSKLAKNEVKVALSADGGDEVFCGYSVYFQLDRYLKKLNRIPSHFKPLFSSLGTKFADNIPFLRESTNHKLHSFFKSLNKNEIIQSRDLFQLLNEKPEFYVNKFLKNVENVINSPYCKDVNGFQCPLDIAMAIDYQVYFQNDILTKVDRATMSVSLEGREPFTDHRLVEFSAQLPLVYKYNGLTGKQILKDIVHEYVPKSMMDRPKTGFSLPINSWLRSDLSYLLDEYLSYDALKWSGIFEEKFVVGEVVKFRSKKLHYSTTIWYILMFQMWYKRWMT